MARIRVRLSVLGILASGSLLTNFPWPRVLRLLHESVESDSVGLLVAVLSNFWIDIQSISTALSWLLTLGVLYTYTDVIYLRRMAILTDRRGFRLITAVFAGGFAAFLISEIQLNDSVPSIGLILFICGILAYSLYLRFAEIDVFDYGKMPFVLLTKMSVADSETLIVQSRDEVQKVSGWYRHVLAGSFYATPAALFTFSCLILGIIMGLLVFMYPLPELTVLAVIGASLLDRFFSVGISEEVRSRIDVEHLIVEPLSKATSSQSGLFLTLVCLIGLMISAIVFIYVPISIKMSVSHFIEISAHAYSLGTGSGVLDKEWMATVLFLGARTTPFLALLVWSVSGIFFWIFELQRLPAVVQLESVSYDNETVGNRSDLKPSTPRLPGAMIPANVLFFLGFGVFIGILRNRIGSKSPAEYTYSFLGLVGLYILTTVLLIWVCWRIIRSVWSRSPSSVARESLVIIVASIGMIWAVFASGSVIGAFRPEVLGTGHALSTVRGNVQVGLLGSVAVLFFILAPKALEISEHESSGSNYDDTIFLGVILSITTVMAFLTYLIPSTPFWFPVIFIGLGIFAIGDYLKKRYW